MNKTRLASAAVALWVVWTGATYLLEGYSRTLLRPDAIGLRMAYALIANIAIGIVGTAVVVRISIRGTGLRAGAFGFESALRTAGGVAFGAALGLTVFLVQRPVTTDLTVIANAFAQVWVVSIAEVLVCWVALARVVTLMGPRHERRAMLVAVAWVTAAVAFGVYHLAHSPPFNSIHTIGVLTIVGLVTGAFYFATREVYGTIVFHNFLALSGVTAALAAGGRLDQFAALQPALIVTAAAATTFLIGADVYLRRAGVDSTANR